MSGRSVLIDTAAALLGVSRRTVYYRIRAGRLRTIRTRNGSQRVLCDSLEALLRETAPPAASAASGDDRLEAMVLSPQSAPL
jgi:excisionase family DNA binding protein